MQCLFITEYNTFIQHYHHPITFLIGVISNAIPTLSCRVLFLNHIRSSKQCNRSVMFGVIPLYSCYSYGNKSLTGITSVCKLVLKLGSQLNVKKGVSLIYYLWWNLYDSWYSLLTYTLHPLVWWSANSVASFSMLVPGLLERKLPVIIHL